MGTFFGAALISIGGLISLANWYAPIASYRSGRFVSQVPLLGGLLLATGTFLVTASWICAALAAICDLGTIVTLLAFPGLIRQAVATASEPPVRLDCRDRGRVVTLKLYEGGRAAFLITFDSPESKELWSVSPGFVQMSLAAQWCETADGYEVFGYPNGRSLTLVRDGEIFVAHESELTEDADPLTRLDGAKFA